jgi:outer membrane biosynthesis protein TonB
MARLSALLIAFALGITAAVALVSCGSGSDANLLPGTTADEIEANLDAVEQLAAEEDCFGAEDAVAQVVAEVEELDGVDAKLKRALEEGTAKLSEVVGRCEEETAEESEPAVETAVEPEEVEDEKEKPKKEKPEKEEPAETKEEPAEEGGPELPPQSNGKGEEKGGGPPPAETEPEETAPSGGVGPGVGVE